MRNFTLAVLLCPLAAFASAAEPVSVALSERTTVRTSLVSLGDVAAITGGTERERAAVAKLDLVEISAREPNATLTRRYVETRLVLAGFEPTRVAVSGPERIAILPARRPVTANEIEAAARAELARQLPFPATAVRIELVQPIAAKLPEVLLAEAVAIAAKPRTKVLGLGRVQVDVTVSAGGERLLALGVFFEVKPILEPADPKATAAPTAPASPAPPAANEVLVKSRQRVSMTARIGEVKVTAVGEAQQDGRAGQTVLVQNVDSKKVVSARVTGPGAVEIDLGGAP